MLHSKKKGYEGTVSKVQRRHGHEGFEFLANYDGSWKLMKTPRRSLKQCPWGTILENSASSDKKSTILVPQGHQNEVVPQKVPFYGQMVPQGHCFGAIYFFECTFEQHR